MQLNVTKRLSLLVLLAGAGGILGADSFTNTYTGSLASSSAVIEENFSLSSASNLVVTTTSYGGGVNLDQSVANAGGFQPNVTLYTSGGTYVTSQQAGSPVATTDPATTLAVDSYLSVQSLSAGAYILTLTNWLELQPITATNLSDGFVNNGGALLYDVDGNTRNANYALNIVVTPSASAVPEPETIGLTLLAFSTVIIFAHKRLRSEPFTSK